MITLVWPWQYKQRHRSLMKHADWYLPRPTDTLFLPPTVCALKADSSLLFVPWCVTVMLSDRPFSSRDVTEIAIPYQGQNVTAVRRNLEMNICDSVFQESCQMWMHFPVRKSQNMWWQQEDLEVTSSHTHTHTHSSREHVAKSTSPRRL